MPESQLFREDKRKLRLTYDGKAKGRKFTVSNTMNSLGYKPKIDGTLEEVRAFSFKEKKESLFDESKTDKLLDNFLPFVYL